MFYLKIILVFVFVYSCQFREVSENCLQTRAVFDVGSGTTKMSVVNVDVCKNRIVEVNRQERLPVAYSANFVVDPVSKEKVFNEKIMQEGELALEKLKSIAISYKPQKYIGVATSAFRSANNAQSFLDLLKKKLNIDIRIISQQEEAEIAFVAAARKTNLPLENMIVWDIGGGSMQIIGHEKGAYSFYGLEIGAVTFKEKVIKEIQGKDIHKVFSPNPMTRSEFDQAIVLARKMADLVPQNIRELFKKDKFILGVGGLHFFCIYKQVSNKNDIYSLEQIQGILAKRVGLNDQEIGGDYPETDISNLALVLGYMLSLKIDKVMAVRVNLTDGL